MTRKCETILPKRAGRQAVLRKQTKEATGRCEKGRQLPRIAVTLTEEQFAFAKKEAMRKHLSISDVIRGYVRDEIQRGETYIEQKAAS